MQLQTASRKKVKIKLGLQGPSGSGKTKSALLIAYGLCGSWSKIAVIDTENNSAALFSNLGPYNVLSLEPPFTPERYIEALQVCKKANMEVIIIDSISHEWDGSGGILDIHGAMVGNSFTNWSKLTPRHNAFIDHMLQTDAHVIATIRAKQEYVLSEKNGKQVPEKVGLKGITRDGIDYEFTLVYDLDNSLHAKCSKDRTQIFFNKPPFIPNSETGAQILSWCLQGEDIKAEDVKQAILKCTTNEQLVALYHRYPQFQQALHQAFSSHKQNLWNIHLQNNKQNGNHAIN